MPRWDLLEAALERRLSVIADLEWRERDPESHLAAIAGASAQIDAAREELGRSGSIPPRLRHFLERASYAKALDYIRTEQRDDSEKARP